jgi:Tol biopolymer transport system component
MRTATASTSGSVASRFRGSSAMRRRALALIVASLAVVAGACVVGTQPWVAPGLRVLYTSEGSGRAGIRFLVARQENEIALTRGSADETPAYNPVSGWVYFTSREGGGWDLQRVRLSGHDRAPLTKTPQANERWPRPTADGKSLFYTSDAQGSEQIYRSDPDGANAVSVTTGAEPHSQPTIVDSAGTRLVAMAGEGESARLVSITVPADGKESQIQPLEGTSGLPPTGVPSARHDGAVVYVCRGPQGPDICRVDPGKPARRITEDPAEDRDPAWSPDGKRILFSSNRNDQNFELYLMSEDGSDVRRLTKHPGPDREPYWVP